MQKDHRLKTNARSRQTRTEATEHTPAERKQDWFKLKTRAERCTLNVYPITYEWMDTYTPTQTTQHAHAITLNVAVCGLLSTPPHRVDFLGKRKLEHLLADCDAHVERLDVQRNLRRVQVAVARKIKFKCLHCESGKRGERLGHAQGFEDMFSSN